MLVQISGPAKGKSRQLDSLGEIGPALVDLKNKAVSAFDRANQNNVAQVVGPLFDPSAVPQSTNTGNTNTGNMG